MGSLIAIGGGVLSKGAGQAAASATTEAGAESQARIEQRKRDATTREFNRQVARQQPYIDAGKMALPEFIEAISNRGTDVSNLPGTRIQSDIINEFLGENAPDFVKEDAMLDLNASEFEKRKGRLADLLNIGVGGQASAAGSRMNLATGGGRSLGAEGNIRGQSLADMAAGRQNMANIGVSGASSIPVIAAARRGGNTGIVNPLITPQNPRGLTPGQGL
jgi:hypothetical protein